MSPRGTDPPALADLSVLEALQQAVHGAPLNPWSRARFEYRFDPSLPGTIPATRCRFDIAGWLAVFAVATAYSLEAVARGTLTSILRTPDEARSERR